MSELRGRVWIRRINSVVGSFLALLMGGIVLDVTWQVFTRFILKKPSSYTEELAGFLLIWIGLLGASYAFYSRSHLGIDVLTYKLKGVGRQAVCVITNLMVFLFAFFVMGWGGIRLVSLTLALHQVSPALGIKMGYVYIVIPLSGVLIAVYSVVFIWEGIRSQEALSVEKQISQMD
ncbi:TRAP transporter small permease [Acidobacteriota bacterium]